MTSAASGRTTPTPTPEKETAMTFGELQKAMQPKAAELREQADAAEADEFAPWVVESLRRAAHFASLSDQALAECQDDLDRKFSPA